VGRLLATWKAPIDVLRGSSGEEKLLKNAKDECASEALEIATYEALERLAVEVGDGRTAELARRIRRDEERMLARLREEIKLLAAGVARAEVEDRPTYRRGRTGAADAVRGASRRGERRAGGGASTVADRAGKAGEAGARSARAARRRAPSPSGAPATGPDDAAPEGGERAPRGRGARRARPAADVEQVAARELGKDEPGNDAGD
jgi:hypothetical protein